jgi:branched-chain amino acid transport system ATP-binding protein
MAVLVSDKVTKRFGGLEAVSKVDLEVKENAIYSIIGPNGAGKTTFFNCVTGFYTPEEGTILLKGRNITGMSPDRVVHLGISRTYQNIRLFKNMTAVENILVGMQPHLKSGLFGSIFRDPRTNREEKEAVEEANRLLHFINLTGKGDLLAKNLPYGEQRRLEIARALAGKPVLLLLDEPTAHLDITHQVQILDLVRRLNRREGMGVILVLHDLNYASEYCDRLTLLYRGRLHRQGSPEEVLTYQIIEEVYQTTVVVRQNPISGRPFIFVVSEEEKQGKRNIPGKN